MGMTACGKCKHYLHQVKNDAAPWAWYNHRCQANALPATLDPIVGKYEPEELAYCRDVNKGHCWDFEPPNKP